jgi:hypothetical protein
LHFVALFQVDGAILVEESKFEEAENCLKHLLDTHKNWSGLAEKVHTKLKEMYRATGQTEKFGDMLKTMVVAQSRMDFYKEYKDFVPKQQWKVAVPQVQCRICQDIREYQAHRRKRN